MSILAPDEVDTPEILKPELSAAQIAARERVYATPLEELDPADPAPFASEQMWWKFERLRAVAPVHYTSVEHTQHDAYWSITKWDDIIAIDTDSVNFTNETPASMLIPGSSPALIRLAGPGATPEQIKAVEDRGGGSLLSMDPPSHGIHRGAVAEGVSPAALADFEPLIRERIGGILDGLPIGEEFDWVDLVSKDLTAMTLATLFNYPQEKRRQLTHWSDVLTTLPAPGRIVETIEEKDRISLEFEAEMFQLLEQRKSEPAATDFISLMAHSPHVKDFSQSEIRGDIGVLLIGGNDTTRNTLSGSVYALDRFPDQAAKLYANPKLIPSMVSETIRWQTPLSHMMRRANHDMEFRGQQMRKGDKIALWYVSGNRDDSKLDRPNEYIVDRKNPRQHLSFGFGIHRCLGNRLAELQLRLTWEEILKRFPKIQVVGEPERTFSNFVKGYESMTVVIPRRH